MQLYKDGKVVRTYYEQVDHLTKEHEKQLTINQNIANQLQSLTENSGIGGADYVRFAFQKNGIFYRLVAINFGDINDFGDIGDYIEVTSKNLDDIPAYGYIRKGEDNNPYFLSDGGDFAEKRTSLTIINITKNTSKQIEVLPGNYSSFTGTSLLDINANNVKNRIFNVMNDLSYGTKTQYVSFDLNNDGNYNYVFIGAIEEGKNGSSIYSANMSNISSVVTQMSVNDYILFAEDNTGTLVDQNAKIGDLYIYNGNSSYTKIGNIRGAAGQNGAQGVQGTQGIQGQQGVQGIQGLKGDTGEKGESGMALQIHTGVLNSASELPEFSTATVGDAYRVINTSGTVVTYDLYFKAVDGTTWDIQPNWGGIKGDKGDKGEVGPQGVQGVQGPQGPQGIQGIQGQRGAGVFRHVMKILDFDNYIRIEGLFTCNREEPFTEEQSFLNYLLDTMKEVFIDNSINSVIFPDIFDYASGSSTEPDIKMGFLKVSGSYDNQKVKIIVKIVKDDDTEIDITNYCTILPSVKIFKT